MSDFVVKIDTTKLNEKQAAQVAGAIQGAVLRELAKLDLAPHKGPSGAITFHPEWRGIWLRAIKDLQRVPDAEIPTLAVVER
jgi:hypothetical protein